MSRRSSAVDLSTVKDVYRRRNAAKMKRKYNDLDAYQKQVYCVKKNKHRKGQNMGVACLDTDEVSSGPKGSIIKGNVCLAIHELEKMPNCIHCGAMKFQYECPTFCCDNGKVKLTPIEVPDELYELFTSQTEEGKQFRINIRLFNSMFSFTSLGVKLDKELASARQGVYTFRAQGVVYHDLPSLLPKEDGPGYFQLYFVETEREVENRMGIFPNSSLSKSTVNKLINVLDINPYAKVFRRLKDYPSMDEVRLHISKDAKLDQRVYNCPTTDQVAAIWVEGNNVNIPFERDIVIHAHSGARHRIKHYFGCYDPLHYPLLFPRGDGGWHQKNFKLASDGNSTQKEGQLQMQTSASSLLQINTVCEEYNHMLIWLQTHGTPVNTIEMSMARRMKDLDSITLQHIYYNRADIIEGKYYCLRGFVAKVMNKTSLWYESCKKCTSSVNKNDGNKMCKKCNDVVETTPIYRLVLNVVEANLSGTITLFEDVGMVYVGCSIEDYIRSIEQGEESSDYYRGLSLQSTTEFQFLIQINHKSYNSRGEMNVVAEAIARLQPINDVDMKESSSKSPKAPSRLPKNQEASQIKQVQRRKRVADKMKEDANDSIIEIDDDETISSLKKKCVRKNSKGKEKKASSPIITIKKEKS